MKTIPLFIFTILVAVTGFVAIMFQMSGVSGSLDDLIASVQPGEISLSTANRPLDVNMQAQQCVDLKKTVNGVEIVYPCCRNQGETIEEWGARCAAEFAEFCEGYGG